MKILGIETSCDETAIAVVEASTNSSYGPKIAYHEVYSQIEQHRPYGGVMPEVASRCHVEMLPKLIARLKTSYDIKQIDAIAVTSGPGLIGGLIVGQTIAKGIAFALQKPVLSVNHLEGHLLTPMLENQEFQFPYLIGLFSGGHCQVVQVKNLADYNILSTTIDDSVGEAFDKVGKMLGLPYPAGKYIEELAQHGDAQAFEFPKPLLHEKNFSFSGLKTAVKRTIDKLLASQEETNSRDGSTLSKTIKQNIAASFQETVCVILEKKVANAMQQDASGKFSLAGGVASNQSIRNRLKLVAQQHGYFVDYPSKELCTDNAAMIAFAGLMHFKTSSCVELSTQQLSAKPMSRWQP